MSKTKTKNLIKKEDLSKLVGKTVLVNEKRELVEVELLEGGGYKNLGVANPKKWGCSGYSGYSGNPTKKYQVVGDSGEYKVIKKKGLAWVTYDLERIQSLVIVGVTDDNEFISFWDNSSIQETNSVFTNDKYLVWHTTDSFLNHYNVLKVIDIKTSKIIKYQKEEKK